MPELVQFEDFNVKQIAHEYYQRYIKYGVVHASIWLQSNLDESKVGQFKKVQPEIARKYGLR